MNGLCFGIGRACAVLGVSLWFAVATVSCSGTPAVAAPSDDRDAMVTEYRSWLDDGRTPMRIVEFVRTRSPGFTVIDHLEASPKKLSPGARLMFIDRDRTVLLVTLGHRPIVDAGVRLIAAHIDTPSPRLDFSAIAKNDKRPVLTAKAYSYGGVRMHHWLHTPLALVGRIALSGDREIDVTLGLDDDDDFALYATQYDRRSRSMDVTLASIAPRSRTRASDDAEPEGASEAGPGRPDADVLFRELATRYGVQRRDLLTAELYLVPKGRAREVGVDRSLLGAHGQDDRSNSYAAWRALLDLNTVPQRTAMTWLVDREEEGSFHVAGATSRFLEHVVAYLLRCQDTPATEATLARALYASVAISADTPGALNPNWTEVHEPQHAPIVGNGAAMFPYTGRGGKDGGNQAHAALMRSVIDSFARAKQPLQTGTLGRVDEGGGGTIAKHLAYRGIDVVDVGIAGISLHSPFELIAKDDLISAYRGFRAWLAQQ